MTVQEMLPGSLGKILRWPTTLGAEPVRGPIKESSCPSAPIAVLAGRMEGPGKVHQRLPFYVKRYGTQALQGSIFLPFHTELEDFGDAIGQANIQWAQRFGLVRPGSRRLEALTLSQFDQLGCLVYSAGNQAHVELGTNLMTSLWVFDDMIDSAQSEVSNDLSIIAHVVEYLGKAIETRRRPFELRDDVPHRETLAAVADAMIDVVERLIARSDAERAVPFIQFMKDYLQGCVEEAEWLNRPVRSLDEYREIRAHSSAVSPCVEFGFTSRGHRLSVELRRDPLFQRMVSDTSLCVAYVNDIFSYEKDRLHGVVSNLVILFEELHGLDPAAAIGVSIDYIERTVICDFVEAKRELEQSRWFDDAARCYVEQMESWMRGNFDWYARGLTERYVRCLSLADRQEQPTQLSACGRE